MARHTGCRALGASLCALWAVAAAAAQEVAPGPRQAPTFTTSVDLLQFHAAVTDDEGRPVVGLVATDFAVMVDGESRDVSVAYEINLGPETSLGPGVPPAASRQFVLFFDAAFNSPRGVRAAQEAALSFVSEMVLPTDLVSVVTHDAVEGVRTRVALTRDRRQVHAAIEELGLTTATRNVDRAGFLTQLVIGDMGDTGSLGAGSEPEGSAAVQGQVAAALGEMLSLIYKSERIQYHEFATRQVEQVGELARALQAVRGRKHVLFFTTGIDDYAVSGASLDALGRNADLLQRGQSAQIDTEALYGDPGVKAAYDRSVRELRQADALMHVVDTSGLGGGVQDAISSGLGMSTLDSGGSGRDSLTLWASGTGGTITWNTNRLAEALAELERSTRHYYVLGIPRLPDDAPELRLKVTLSSPDLGTVSAPTHFAPPPAYADMGEMQRQAQLAEAVAKGLTGGQLNIELIAPVFPGRRSVARVPIVVEIPWRHVDEIGRARGDDLVTLDLLSYVVTAEGAIVDASDRQIELDLREMGRVREAQAPLRIYDLLWAWPGDHSVHVVVRDSQAGRLSATSRAVHVPDPGQGVLSVRTVVIDTEHPGLVLRVFDENSPPAHKMDGPVAYPFALDGETFTPSAAPSVDAGGVIRAYVLTAGLKRHPLSGRLRYSLEVGLVDVGGESRDVEDVQLEARQDDVASGEAALILAMRVPRGLATGDYRLAVAVTDEVGGTTSNNVTRLEVRSRR